MAPPYTLAPPLPVMIPIPLSRPVTPTYPPRRLEQGEIPAVDSNVIRPRSDTTCTTSSSSSFPILQTPPTPSILSRLDHNTTSPFSSDVVSLDKGKGRPRQESYGFGSALEWGPSKQANDLGASDFESEIQAGELSNIRLEALRIESAIPADDQALQEEPAASRDDPKTTLSGSSNTNHFRHEHEGFSTAGSDNNAPGPSSRYPPANAILPVTTSLNLLPPPFPVEGPATRLAKPGYSRSRSSFKVAVRRKLERSRGSFKGLRGASNSQEEHDTLALADAEHGEHIAERPQKSRLKSLFFSPRRSASTASIRSTHTSTSSPALSLLLPSSTDLPTSSRVGATGGDRLASTDPAVSPARLGARRDGPQNQVGLDRQADLLPAAGRVSDTVSTSENEFTDPLTFRLREKGKDRLRGPQFSAPTRPTLPSYVSTGPPDTLPSAHMTIISTSTRSRLFPPRTVSMPLLEKAASTSAVLEYQRPKLKVDLFNTMLPRELKVRILEKMLAMHKTRFGDGRWDCEIGGHRELVKFSRVRDFLWTSLKLAKDWKVCRSWQSLCFDGQLWPSVHLAPLAPFLHPSTMRRIFVHTQSFVTSLSLRGMDDLIGTDLVSGLGGISDTDRFRSALGPPFLSLPSLRHLDLRGCKLLSSDYIAAIVTGAPELRSVNLKGLRGVSATVIRALARTAHHLECLDVSRCWDVSLCDLVVFIRMLTIDQAARLKVLKLGGIKGYGHTAAELLPAVAERLVNLETLDLLGCTHLFDSDFEHYVQALNTRGQPSPLQHLVISGCSAMTSATFGVLAGKVPEMRKLEMASLPDIFRDPTVDDKGLIRLLKSVPKLERLDLEGTGVFGGVTDVLLDAITPGRHERGEVVGKELVELRIGHAKDVTPEAMIRLVRGCSKLTVLEADNTTASNAVMREFLRRRSDESASLNLIDCRSITPSWYSAFAPTTRPRAGWSGFQAVPFGYTGYSSWNGGSSGQGEMGGKPVLKTFWSWKRVAVPKQWREAIIDKEKVTVVVEEVGAGRTRSTSRAGVVQRKGSWWRDEGEEAGRGACVLM